MSPSKITQSFFLSAGGDSNVFIKRTTKFDIDSPPRMSKMKGPLQTTQNLRNSRYITTKLHWFRKETVESVAAAMAD